MSERQSASSANDDIVKRLDALIRLTLEEQRGRDDKLTIGDQIVMLESAGLAGKDVARIMELDVNQLPSYRRRAKSVKQRKGGQLP